MLGLDSADFANNSVNTISTLLDDFVKTRIRLVFREVCQPKRAVQQMAPEARTKEGLRVPFSSLNNLYSVKERGIYPLFQRGLNGCFCISRRDP